MCRRESRSTFVTAYQIVGKNNGPLSCLQLVPAPFTLDNAITEEALLSRRTAAR
jgi:hypothetical protein